jgi:cytosine/adenosine deaminase-related metal-dependent hydrolase
MTQRLLVSLLCALVAPSAAAAQTPQTATLLQPDRVFDGITLHDGWVVLVRGERIEAVGPAASVQTPAGAQSLRLAGQTVLPGLIEGHSHVLLHAYDETTWNDQVAREPLAYRVARAVVHAERTLMARRHDRAGFGHGGRRICRRGAEACHRRGHREGPRMLAASRFWTFVPQLRGPRFSTCA